MSLKADNEKLKIKIETYDFNYQKQLKEITRLRKAIEDACAYINNLVITSPILLNDLQKALEGEKP